MEKSVITKRIKSTPAQLVILGVTDDRKARAARFEIKDEAAVRRCAAALNMRCGVAKSDQAKALSSKLPAGRIFDSGVGLIPAVRSEIYFSLSELLTFDQTFCEIGVISGRGTQATPELIKAADALWSSVRVGSTVLVWTFEHSEPGDGGNFAWSAAVVIGISNNGETLEVRFRDWPDSKIKVRRQVVALLRPDVAP
jgi:hypothetical protein